jgi:hypothetical protein
MPGGIVSQLRGQREATQVSKETEVTIPWETYKRLLLLGPVSILAFWCIGWLIWLTVAVNARDMSAGQWVVERWWPHVTHWWMLPIICCFLWWSSAPTWATAYRYLVETVIKNPPLYGEWKPENGMWWPFVNWRRRRIERAGLKKTYHERFGRGKDRE